MKRGPFRCGNQSGPSELGFGGCLDRIGPRPRSESQFHFSSVHLHNWDVRALGSHSESSQWHVARAADRSLPCRCLGPTFAATQGRRRKTRNPTWEDSMFCTVTRKQLWGCFSCNLAECHPTRCFETFTCGAVHYGSPPPCHCLTDMIFPSAKHPANVQHCRVQTAHMR